MRKKNVQMLSGVRYQKIDDNGLHIEVDGENRLLEVDNVVICAGQLSVNDLYQALNPYGKEKQVHLIGGAYLAAEVDAKRAIREGAKLGARI
jgi:2,4-dienoyl-CoA reductase (NADPH2)